MKLQRSISRLVAWIRGHLEALRTGINPRVEGRINSETSKLNSEIADRMDEKFAGTQELIEKSQRNVQNQIASLSGRLGLLEEGFRNINSQIDLRIKDILSRSSSTSALLLPERTFIVNPGMTYWVPLGRIDLRSKSDAKITGRIVALGGSGNDVNFFVVDERNFAKFKAGRGYSTLENIDRASSVEFGVPITHSDNYYFLFDNSFSSFSQKTVSVNASLEYETLVI